MKSSQVFGPSALSIGATDCDDVERNRSELVDLRFRNLIGETEWSRLPVAVRRRFSKCLSLGEVALYRGQVIETRISILGRVLAKLLTLVGSPLPKQDGARGTAVVSVHEDVRFGGQVWTRLYGREGRRTHVITSVKRFFGPTGLEEHIGFGIGMSLKVSVDEGALVFRSVRYFLAPYGDLRLTIPAWLCPGRLEVVHEQETGEWFSFRLTLRHWMLGLLVSQTAHFQDVG